MGKVKEATEKKEGWLNINLKTEFVSLTLNTQNDSIPAKPFRPSINTLCLNSTFVLHALSS